MKIYEEGNKNIIFYSSTPLEFLGEAEATIIQTAKSLDQKKGFSVTIYAPPLTPNQHPFSTREQILIRLGKVSYKNVNMWAMTRISKNTDYIFLRNDIRSLLPALIPTLLYRQVRRQTIVQCYTPIKLPESEEIRYKRHNVVYGSAIYRLFLRVISEKYQVFSTTDKRLIKGASLIKPPCDQIFFEHTSHLANTQVGNKIKVLYYNDLTAKKGFDLFPGLIRSLERRKMLDRFKFTIIGQGDMQEIAQKLVKKHKNIQYKPKTAFFNLPELFDSQNVFLSLSLFETSPLIISEAMSRGLLVLAFDIPALYSNKTKDVMYFSPKYNVAELAKRLIEISSMKKSMIKEKSEQVVEYANKEFRMDNYVKKLLTFIYS
jgi:glycosyltransferase involved in cell wall biosynthesis